MSDDEYKEPVDDEEDDDDPEYDVDRYGTAIGWNGDDPDDPYRKQKDAALKQHALDFCRDSLLEVRPASRWIDRDLVAEPGELLGDLWRPGELAVLFGETGTGKSIFAMHIAESIARGRAIEPFPAPAAQRVLYLDFAQTADQFTRRYTCPRTTIGKLRIRYRFSGRLKRAGFGDIFDIPDVFEGDLSKYFQHSIDLVVRRTGAKVLIIDDLSYLDYRSTGNAASLRRMRSLKLMAAETGTSILVLQTIPRTKSSRQRSQLSVLNSQLAAIADTAMLLQFSTFAPDVRYLKHLKSNNLDSSLSTHPSSLESPVLTYRLERSPGPRSTERRASAPSTGAQASLLALNSSDIPNSPNSSLIPHPSSLPNSPSPFLGFTYLGQGPESDHHRDYAAEALQAELDHQKALRRLWKRSSKDILVDAVMDGSYGRYLKGE